TQAPTISTLAATVLANQVNTVIIKTTGFPAPTFSTGTLPSWVTVVDNGDGTATLTARPASANLGAPTTFSITAQNTVANGGTQTPASITKTFTLTVQQAPVFPSTDPTTATFQVGKSGTSATISVTPGTPSATTLSVSGKLPAGALFSVTGN